MDHGYISSERREQLKLRYYLRFILVISLFFWFWAIYNTNTMKKGFDMGIFSFLTTLSSSAYLLFRSRGGVGGGSKAPTKISRGIFVFCHFLVSCNYALGLLYAMTIGEHVMVRFATYCASFMILWLVGTVWSWKLITNVMNTAQREEDELENLYNFGGGGGGAQRRF